MRYIQQTLGEDFAWQISQAEDIWRNSTWQPLSIQEYVDALMINENDGFKCSQLLDVIVELLVNLSDDLQGRSHGTPSAIDLWKLKSPKQIEKQSTHRRMQRLSDYVERYLRRSLIDENIFISREAQIRRGSLTDIYIETRELNENGAARAPLVVVVEQRVLAPRT